MGVSCHARCGRCHCGKCQIEGSPTTLQERFEFNQSAGAVAIAALRYLADVERTELPRAAETITNQSYVDDLIDSVDQYDAAVKITEVVDTILALGNFEVKKWSPINSTDLTGTSNATISDCVPHFTADSDSDSRFSV